MTEPKPATLYRMVLSDQPCPFGVRAIELLTERGFEVDDRILTTREDVEQFKQEQEGSTTPQIFMEGERIGGCEDLEAYLDEA